MTHWRKVVSKDSPHLNVWDIEGHSPLSVTIESWAPEQVHDEEGREKTMLFLTFRGGKKALGVNVTNAHLIAQQHGPDVDGWIGKKITLRCATCRGEPCIRVAIPAGTKMPKRLPRFTYTDTERGGAAPSAPEQNEQGDKVPY